MTASVATAARAPTPGTPWAAAAVVFALLLAALPVVSLELPGLIDLPNTVARASIRSQLGSEPFYDVLYRRNSPFVPNAAFDVIFRLANGLLSPIAIGQACATLAIVLTVTGVVAVAWTLGSHVALAALLGAAVAHDYSLTWGFLNYQLGVGLMLWATALWLRVRARSVRVRVLAPSAIALAMYFCHVLPLAVYALLVAGVEVELWRRDRGRLGTLARTLAVAGSQFLAPALLFVAVSPTSGELQHIDPPALWSNLRGCAKALHAGLGGADYLHLGLLAGLAAMLVGLGRVRVSVGARLPLALLAAVCLVAPDKTDQAAGLQQRLPVVLAFLAAAVVRWTPGRAGRARFVLVAGAVALGVRTVALWSAYRERAVLVRDAHDLLAAVPDRALLFTIRGPLSHADGWAKYRVPLEHAACLRALRGPVVLPQLLVSTLHHTVAPANDSVGALRQMAAVGTDVATGAEIVERVRALQALVATSVARGECPPLPGGIWLAAVHFAPEFEFPSDVLEPGTGTPHLRLFRVR